MGSGRSGPGRSLRLVLFRSGISLGRILFDQSKFFEEVLKPDLRAQPIEIRLGLDGDHGRAPIFETILKQGEGLILVSCLSKTPGCGYEVTAVFERFPV